MLTISNSEIQLFKACRRSWYVQYYLQRKPPITMPVGATYMGTRLHAALEGYYSPAIKFTADESKNALFCMYQMDEREFPEAYVGLWKEYDLASVMLDGYFTWLEETGEDAYITVASVEREISVPISSTVNIRGRLDMSVFDSRTGSKLFMDHKTCIAFLSEDYLDRDEQAKFYMMLQRLEGKDQWCDGGMFNMLRKVKRGAKAVPPFYMRTVVKHNNESLNSMFKRTYHVCAEIEDTRAQLASGVDHQQIVYPTPTKDCAWRCPLAAGACSMMDDGSDWVSYLEDQWQRVDPNARYTEDSYLDRLDQEGLL